MLRTVSAHLSLNLYGDADLIFSVAVAQGLADVEELTIVADGQPIEATEIVGRHGTRLHRVAGHQGPLTLDYGATVSTEPTPPPVEQLDIIEYRRPSRYCESDTLFALARSEFAGLEGVALLDAVDDWVHDHLRYVPGVSQVTDGAVKAFLARRGICRDYAHLVVALLRALDVPARLASVYAPGLVPMDFHAVAEAYVDGQWYVVDATGLAPRQSLVRIATGQDASETAFLTQHGAAVDLLWMRVDAQMDDVPEDDHHGLVVLT